MLFTMIQWSSLLPPHNFIFQRKYKTIIQSRRVNKTLFLFFQVHHNFMAEEMPMYTEKQHTHTKEPPTMPRTSMRQCCTSKCLSLMLLLLLALHTQLYKHSHSPINLLREFTGL